MALHGVSTVASSISSSLVGRKLDLHRHRLYPPAVRRSSISITASLSSSKDSVLYHFYERRALKIISGLLNCDRENVAAVVTAADKGGATHVDIACDPELVEIGNYDSFYDMGKVFSAKQVLYLTRQTKKILPNIALSVTVPHNLALPDQVKLAESLVNEGADIIQTEGGKCSNPIKPGVLGLIEKACPTLAAAYSISRAVSIPVMCSSGLSTITAPMALAAGAAGVGVGSAVNKLNNVIAMIAEVKSIAGSLTLSTGCPIQLSRAIRS